MAARCRHGQPHTEAQLTAILRTQPEIRRKWEDGGASHFIVVIVIGVGVIYVLIWTAAILVCGAQHLRVDVWERTLSAFIKFIVLKGSVSQMKQAEQSSF